MTAITITMANVDVLILLMPVWRMWPMSRYATDSAELVEVLNIDIDVQALTHCLYRKQVFKLGLYLRLNYLSAKIFIKQKFERCFLSNTLVSEGLAEKCPDFRQRNHCFNYESTSTPVGVGLLRLSATISINVRIEELWSSYGCIVCARYTLTR